MAQSWTLAPGTVVTRARFHEELGGQRQGGVSPSRESPNVFVFSDPGSGLQHGYVDHWDGEVFHYTGEGQKGDQRMVAGNKAILHHQADGRALRVFRGARGDVEYVGQFEVDAEQPWYTDDAPETGGGPIRTVIVFRLRPVGAANVDRLPADNPKFTHLIDVVPIAASNTEKAWVEPDRQPYEAELREAALVERFRTWLKSRGHEASRLRIVPEGEAKPIFNDVWIPSLNLLVEAKGSCTREAIRMAIGQLADYGRFQQGAALAVLLPAPARDDLRRLMEAAGVACFWESDGTFKSVGVKT
jgi:hypothetical protein